MEQDLTKVEKGMWERPPAVEHASVSNTDPSPVSYSTEFVKHCSDVRGQFVALQNSAPSRFQRDNKDRFQAMTSALDEVADVFMQAASSRYRRCMAMYFQAVREGRHETARVQFDNLKTVLSKSASDLELERVLGADKANEFDTWRQNFLDKLCMFQRAHEALFSTTGKDPTSEHLMTVFSSGDIGGLTQEDARAVSVQQFLEHLKSVANAACLKLIQEHVSANIVGQALTLKDVSKDGWPAIFAQQNIEGHSGYAVAVSIMDSGLRPHLASGDRQWEVQLLGEKAASGDASASQRVSADLVMMLFCAAHLHKAQSESAKLIAQLLGWQAKWTKEEHEGSVKSLEAALDSVQRFMRGTVSKITELCQLWQHACPTGPAPQ